MAGKAKFRPVDVHPDVRMFVDEYSYQDRYYSCLCECGTPCLARRDTLLDGRKISCGCIKRHKRYPYDHLDGTYAGNFYILHVEGVIGLVECQCGEFLGFYIRDILSGRKSSCGCLTNNTIVTNKLTGEKQSMYEEPEYSAWLHMQHRCYKKDNAKYNSYGGRGIKVCGRWLYSFQNFYEDMGPRPDGFSLDRIDNNGNYEPGNCRWADIDTQMGNQQKTIRINIDGEVKSLRAWTRKFNMNYSSVYSRVIYTKRKSLAEQFHGKFKNFIKFEEVNK